MSLCLTFNGPVHSLSLDLPYIIRPRPELGSTPTLSVKVFSLIQKEPKIGLCGLNLALASKVSRGCYELEVLPC